MLRNDDPLQASGRHLPTENIIRNLRHGRTG